MVPKQLSFQFGQSPATANYYAKNLASNLASQERGIRSILDPNYARNYAKNLASQERGIQSILDPNYARNYAKNLASQERGIQSILNPNYARNYYQEMLATQNRAIAAINNPVAAQRLIGQNQIVNSIVNPSVLPYNGIQGIDMSGGIPYGAITTAKFNPSAIPMGVNSGATQAARGGLLSIPQGGPGNALLPQTNATRFPAGGYSQNIRFNGSNLVNEVPVTIRSGVTGSGGGGIPAMPAGALEAGATEASIASKGAGLLARLGYAPSGVGRLGAFIRPGLTGFGAAGILGAGYGAGQIAGSLVDKINVGGKESAFDRFATGAAFGAPIGAAIGNVIPIPVVGAGIGALAGAGIGGVGSVVKGIFEDNDKADMTRSNQKRMNSIDSLFEKAGLTPNQMAQYRAQFDTSMAILGDNPKPSDVGALLTQLETQIQKSAGSNAGKLTGKDMVALQAAIGQYMQPLIQQQQQSGQLAANMYNQMAGNMNNSALADQMRAQAANAQAQSDRMTAAYMGQAQSIPALYGLQQLGQLANNQQSTKSATFAEALAANGAG